MSKLKLFLLFLLICLFFSVCNVTAATVDKAYIVSDTRNGVWQLQAGCELNSTPTDGPSVSVLEIDYVIPTLAPFFPGAYWVDLPTIPPINNTSVLFSVDGYTVSGRVPDSVADGYPGVFGMPDTTYNGTIGGTAANPIISWTNSFNSNSPPGVLLDDYALRIYDRDNPERWLIDHRISTGLESEDQTFDFSSITFEFDPTKEYDIGIEARKYTDIKDIYDPDDVLNGLFFIINRNVVTNEYNALDNPDDFFILTDTSPNATVTAGSDTVVYGTAGENAITLESSAKADLLNFPGNNTITIQSDSNLFMVSRSGATVTFEGSDGTVLKIPATSSAQTIAFTDQTLTLNIYNNQVMLDEQVIGLGSDPVSQTTAVYDDFTGPLIDNKKWVNTEFARETVDGKLSLKVANTVTLFSATVDTGFIDASGVYSIESSITVLSTTRIDTGV